MAILQVGPLAVQVETRCDSGPEVEVWLGRLADSGHPVLVKRAKSVAQVAALRREARVLGALNSPYFARLLATDGEGVIVTEALPGPTLAVRIQQGPLPLEEGLRLVHDLLSALSTLHHQGWLHGDLKPEHVLLGPDRATVCDLGLAHEASESTAEGPAGVTPAYASPEALGLISSHPGPSSDLYSVGLILHSAFSGFKPGRDLEWRLRSPARDASLPLVLQLFLDRLTRPDPKERYQSASAALDDGNRLRREWTESGHLGSLVLGTTDPRTCLTEPCPGGREKELDWLENQVRCSRGSLLTGPAGRGKRTLGRLLAQRLEQQGWRIIRLGPARHGTEWSDSPERQLLEWMESRLDPQEWQALKQEVEPWHWSILRPDFAGSEHRPLSSSGLGEALARAFGSLHKRRSSLILWEDAEIWCETKSRTLWQALEGRIPWLAVCSASPTEDFDSWELQPLDRLASRALLCSMAGPLPEPITDTIFEQARGEPFLLVSFLRGAVESGQLRWAGEKWDWSGASVPQTDRAAAWQLTERLGRLSSGALALLRQGAVQGASFSVSLACRLSSVESDLLLEPAQRHLIWLEGDRAGFYHDLVHQAVLASWRPDELRQAHLSVALALEKETPAPQAEIAFHLVAAGCPERALPSAVLAAIEAESGNQNSQARQLWGLAEAGLSESSPRETRYRVMKGLAKTTLAGGDAAQALQYFEQALLWCDSSRDRALLIEGKIRAMSRAFQVEHLRASALEGLRELGRQVPKAAPGWWSAALSQLVALPLQLARPSGRPLGESARLEGRLLVTLAEAAVREESVAQFLWAVGRASRLFLAPQAPAEAAIAWSYGALIYQRLGRDSVSRALLERAREQAERHPSVLGQTTGMAGVWWIGKADLLQALEHFDRAIPCCRALDDGWNLDICRVHRALVLSWMGRLSEAFEEAVVVFTRPASTDPGLRLLVGLIMAESPRWEEVSRNLEEETHSVQGTFLEIIPPQIQGTLALRAQAWGEAVRHFTQAVERHRPETAYYGAGTAAWLAQSWRMILERLPAHGQHLRQDILKEMRRALSQGRTQTRGWDLYLPHLWREQACWQALRGRFERARTLFERSHAMAQHLGMSSQLAATLYERGRIARAAGWSDWLEDEEEGIRLAQMLGAWLPGAPNQIPTWPSQAGRLDRFEKVLSAGRRLALLRRSDEVVHALCAETRTLLRCRQVQFVEIHRLGDCWSETLARQALACGRAVTESEVAEPSRSMLLSEARSHLVAPVLVAGSPVGVLAAHQKALGGFFGKEETQLADYLTTLAGAGLENARTVEARDSLFASLELSEQRFRGFFRHAGIGTALLDAQGRVTEENPYLGEFLGVACTGRRLLDLVYDLDRERVENHLASVQEGSSPVEVESRLCRGTGEVVWAQLTLANLPNPEAESWILVTVSDITHRRLNEMLTFLENERRSLAGDLHDEVAQNAVALSLQLQNNDDPTLESARILSRRLSQDTSRLIASLRGHSQERESLMASLRALLTAFSVEAEIEVEFVVDIPESELVINGLHALVLYRFVQEGLANIRKHARPTQVSLQLERQGRQLQARLRDDGNGFEPQSWLTRQSVTRHFGLLSLVDRARYSGAEFSIQSSPGQGCELTLSFALGS